MLKYKQIELRVSELHALELTIPEWELRILEAIHAGSGGIKLLGEVLINRPMPNVETEYARLATRYRRSVNEDGSQGLPWVATVYGQYGVGQEALRKLIEASYVAAVAPELQPVGDLTDLIGARTVSSVGG